jgi:hypothetical protein
MKLVDRTRPTEAIALVVEAYDKREYNGNLLDLLPTLSKDSFFSGRKKIWRGLKYFFQSLSMNLSLLHKIAMLDSKLYVYINNRELDGFIEYFLERDCRSLSCKDCGYCERVARQVVKISPGYQQKTFAKYKDILNSLIYFK